jgi:hypothetical protein
LPFWYRLLNAGLRVPPVGGSGKDRNSIPLGGMRTYAFLGEGPFTYANWIEAVRAGRTFITNGPLLEFEAREDRRFRATASSVGPVEKVEIVANGEVIAEGSTEVEIDHPLPAGGWVAARCRGPGTVFAHSAPVFVGHPQPEESARLALGEMVRRTRDWVEHDGRFREQRFRDLHLRHCDEALACLGGTAHL